MAEEAKDPGTTSPRRSTSSCSRCSPSTRASRWWRSRRCRWCTVTPATLHDRDSAPPTRTTRCSAIISRLGLHGTVLTIARRLRRHARRDDPVHRDERGPDRDLAAVVVAGRAPPAARGCSRSCTRTYRTPWFTIVFFSVLAGVLILPGEHDAARQPLLVRRDAVVHDRPRRGRSRCASRTPTASGPTGCRGTCRIRGQHDPARPRCSAAIGTFGGVVRRRRAARRGPRDRHPVDGRSGWRATSSTAGARAWTRAAPTGSRAPSARPDFEELELQDRARADLRRRRQRAGAAQRRQADRRGRGRVRGVRAARAEPAVARRGPRGGGGPRPLGARERAHPGAAPGDQDPHRA